MIVYAFRSYLNTVVIIITIRSVLYRHKNVWKQFLGVVYNTIAVILCVLLHIYHLHHGTGLQSSCKMTQVKFPKMPLANSIGWFMVLNATFNNISAISWRSVLLVDETGENHRPVGSHWQTLSHNVVSSTPRHERGSIASGDRHWLHR